MPTDILRRKQAVSKIPFKHPFLEAISQVQYGELSLAIPGGEIISFSGEQEGPEVYWEIYDLRILDEIVARGQIGFAETYINGKWHTDNLSNLILFMFLNADRLKDYFYGKPWQVVMNKIRDFMQGNTISGSKKNIVAHYDLGNEFYSLWLDKSMTYSCALFGDNKNLSLEEAQEAKYNRILNKFKPVTNKHILEIGSGWGGFAEAAARKGYTVTSVTISDAQHEYARNRMEYKGLDKLADIQLLDYRKVEGKFDYIASIGMFEHVGEKYWPTYFQKIKSSLKPQGKAVIQTITVDDKIFDETHGKTGFIEHYIFPGGMLPSKRRFCEEAAKQGLKVMEVFSFGDNYALTLRHWLERFEQQVRKIKSMGYDDSFIRLWRFYLSACIACFTSKRSDVMQVELINPE